MLDQELVECPRCSSRGGDRYCFLCAQSCFAYAPSRIPAALAVEYALVNPNIDTSWYDHIRAMRKRHGYGRTS